MCGSTMKRNEFLSQAPAGLGLENVRLSDRSQSPKATRVSPFEGSPCRQEADIGLLHGAWECGGAGGDNQKEAEFPFGVFVLCFKTGSAAQTRLTSNSGPPALANCLKKKKGRPGHGGTCL
jgi:hypothetical protein